MKISKAKFHEIMRNFNVLDAFVFLLFDMVGILLHSEAFVNRVVTLNDILNRQIDKIILPRSFDTSSYNKC